MTAARNVIPDMEAVCEENERLRADVFGWQMQEAEAHAHALAAESALAALRGQVEAEREACALVADNFPPMILQVWERPGGPPGNGYRQTNGTDIGSAIRARAALATPARVLTDTESALASARVKLINMQGELVDLDHELRLANGRTAAAEAALVTMRAALGKIAREQSASAATFAADRHRIIARAALATEEGEK